jgi:very-short-patch-repair endonuclease
MEDRYLEIERRVGNKIETHFEDMFLTYFLDKGLYERFHIDSQVKFYQKGKYKYRVDFVLTPIGGGQPLAIEVDGFHHKIDTKQRRKDKIRDKELKDAGYKVLRIQNNNVHELFWYLYEDNE